MRKAAVAMIALCASAGLADAKRGRAPAARDQGPTPASFVDPCLDGGEAACTRRALDGLYRALAASEAGKGSHAVRISWFGDSLTADDQITDELRRRLQARFGDGGPGFVYAVPPHPFCEHRAMRRAYGGGWTMTSTVTPVFARDRLLGLGSSAETDDGWLRIAPEAHALATADVFYEAQPHGGALDVAVDGKSAGTVATAGPKSEGFATVPLGGAVTRVDLRAQGHVRLFGVALEAATGLVVDNLGVVNGTATGFARIKPEHWKQELAHRAPDLVVVMLGTNEAEWLPARGEALDQHEAIMEGLLATVRAANPDAACLVISPFDQLDWRTEGAPPRASIPAMVAAQRQAAAAKGCAFWDAYTWMGGKGASLGWYRRGLVGHDFQHPTTAGAHLIADALVAGLLDGYAKYRAR